MNNTTKESQPLYPSLSSPTAKEAYPSHEASLSSSPIKQDTQPHEQAPSSSSSAPPSDDSAAKWGTHIMGQPAVPTCHPDNKKAALWGAGDQAQYHHHPYVQFNPVEKSNSPMESILHKFNSWSHKAENMANNIWHNRMFKIYALFSSILLNLHNPYA